METYVNLLIFQSEIKMDPSLSLLKGFSGHKSGKSRVQLKTIISYLTSGRDNTEQEATTMGTSSSLQPLNEFPERKKGAKQRPYCVIGTYTCMFEILIHIHHWDALDW